MQIALQDIRTLGYKKISKFYLDEIDKDKFFKDLQSLNTLYCAMKIPAYSLLNKWYLIEDFITPNDENIRGYSLFVYNLEPMINLETPSDSAKRKCRNTWFSIWDNFGSIAGLEGYQITLLKDFGLKVLFIYANHMSKSSEISKLCSGTDLHDYDLLLSILDFYNVILTWAIFTQQESNFTKNNLSFIDVLSMLVTNNSEEFKCNLKSVY